MAQPGLSGRQRFAMLVAGVVLAAGLVAGLGAAEAFFSGFYTATSGVHLNATSGPDVVTTKDYQLQNGTPFTSRSVNLSTEKNGYVNVSATGGQVGLTVNEINGTWSNFSAIDADKARIRVNPEDKPAIAFRGADIDTMKLRNIDPTDGGTDFIYSGTGSDAAIVVTNLTANQQYAMVDQDTDRFLDIAEADTNGEANFTDPPLSSHTVSVQETGNVSFREENPPHALIKDQLNVTIFGEEDALGAQFVQNYTVTDGNLSLDGVPADERLIILVHAPNHYDRTSIIPNSGTQNTVFLLHTNQTAVNVTFDISDPTGQFTGEDTEIEVRHSINQSLYNGSGGFTKFVVEGDRIGATGDIRVTLDQGERYQIRAFNGEQTRVLGGHLAETSRTVTLRPTLSDVNVSDEEGYAWNATTNTTDAKYIIFQYNDPDENTTDLRVIIREQNNRSNIIFDSTFAGPHGFIHVAHQLTASQQNESWVVDWNATRNGATIGSERAVSRKVIDTLPALDDIWKHAIAVISIIMVAAVFTQRSAETGAVVVALLAGGWWAVGWLPDAAGGAVLVALVIGVIYKAQSEPSI